MNLSMVVFGRMAAMTFGALGLDAADFVHLSSGDIIVLVILGAGSLGAMRVKYGEYLKKRNEELVGEVSDLTGQIKRAEEERLRLEKDLSAATLRTDLAPLMELLSRQQDDLRSHREELVSAIRHQSEALEKLLERIDLIPHAT